MEVILTQYVPGLGDKHDIIKVKGGYGQNYLIPKKLAIVANATSRKSLAEDLQTAVHKKAKVKHDAVNLSAKVKELQVSIAARAAEGSKIFGTVTALQIVQTLASHAITLNPTQVIIKEPIKTLGEHEVILALHKEVEVPLKLIVVAA